jgi:hypothetical protein
MWSKWGLPLTFDKFGLFGLSGLFGFFGDIFINMEWKGRIRYEPSAGQGGLCLNLYLFWFHLFGDEKYCLSQSIRKDQAA